MMLRKLAIGIVTALPVLLAGCGGDTPASAKGRDQAKGQGKGGEPVGEVREVRVVKAEEGRLARTVDVSGTLAADEQAELGFKVAGRLQQMLVDIGSTVRRGQVIARLTPTDYELRVRQAETSLQQARTQLGLPPQGSDETVVPDQTAGVRQAAATLKQAQLTRDRMARLFSEQLIPQQDLDAAEAALGVADGRHQEAIETARTRQGLLLQRKSELAIARQQLADSILKAPFDGAIRERQASAGDYVAPGAPVAVLVRVHPLRLRLAIPEREAAGIQTGQAVQLTVEGDAGQHTGRVARISPAISEDNRTLMVEAEVPNTDGSLRPGSFAKAQIVIQASDTAVLVPTSSIVAFAGIEKVVGVEAGKAVEKRVTTGRRSGDQIEIVEGVKAGEPVVLQPGNIVTGEAVRVVL
ncbi:MAG TPA: efflux RND transporter periplasmic adaptor subunit [Thermoanaerobaculia bacterium]|nr:efflux RND transporter periplasmic adaptor subunit [Thermoanaerobaculia bacterium]